MRQGGVRTNDRGGFRNRQGPTDSGGQLQYFERLSCYGKITRGTGGCRDRPTVTEPSPPWVAWDELPTTIATVWSPWAARISVAPAIRWSATMPWRRSSSQAIPLAGSPG